MTDRHENPTGDAALEARLKAVGSRFDLAQLRGLLAGVSAAPRPVDPDTWMSLVAADPDDDLKDQLRAFRGRAAGAAKPAVASARTRETARRVAALRRELARCGLAGFITPRSDEHQGEYVSPRAERLNWLTGFTGSAGLAIVLAERAVMFVDGRYTLQAAAQVDGSQFTIRHLIDQPPESWIAENLPKGGRLGYDPWLHTPDALEPLRRAASRAGGELVACPRNMVDAVWSDQPPPPVAPVVAHDLRYAGRASADKRSDLAARIVESGADATVLTGPDSIAWLLNIRGADVPHTPLPLSFAILHGSGMVDLFIDRRKLVPGIESHLGNGIALRDPGELGSALDRLGQDNQRVLVDPSTAAAWVHDRLGVAGAQIVRGSDPCALPKACKNPVEIDGSRAAHRRDGAAVARFLAWLSGAAPMGGLTEIEAAERLAAFRRANELFRDLSFDTISGAGPNGAIVHYRVTPETNRRLESGQIYLIDSGAQYLDGTTDITRTVAIGTPAAEARDRFTRVLKGHIALGSARFPRGTSGSQLDALARMSLWQVGLDYDHGTGHGVGSYLGVHEGPHRISKLPNRVPLEPGMIISNEPGYYKTGSYGIRIENLVTVIESPAAGDERPMLGFETLTLAPIDRHLIDPALLSGAEIAWLDAYHARVQAILTPLVDPKTAEWLAEAAKPLAR